VLRRTADEIEGDAGALPAGSSSAPRHGAMTTPGRQSSSDSFWRAHPHQARHAEGVRIDA
jgi:hypothetical protein